MNIAGLNQLEHDPQVIRDYVKKSAFGKNKLMYLPLIIGIMISMFLAFAVYEGMLQEIGYTLAGILAVVAVLCFVGVAVVNRAAHKKLSRETDFVPICMAQKVYGEDANNNYYAIYTCGAKRHDGAFINHIVNKIFALPANTNDKIEQSVNKLFQKDFIKPGEFAKQLPLSFTEGEVVWRRQFALGTLPKAAQQQIEDNNGQFWVVGLNPENAFLFRQYYM
ncbi:hypothetical protein ACLOAU_12040 [Niabella sp. CJ426]|uniref:hypothetical protein n=1 Tax=Niabella sp. CJ426 TaxID=3393740 RepID=UPI003D0456E6